MVSKGLHKKSAKGLTLALTDVGARRLPALPSQCWTAFHRSQDRCSSRSTETMLDWQPTGSVARRQGSSRRSPAAPASSGSVVPGSQRSLLSDPDEDEFGAADEPASPPLPPPLPRAPPPYERQQQQQMPDCVIVSSRTMDRFLPSFGQDVCESGQFGGSAGSAGTTSPRLSSSVGSVSVEVAESTNRIVVDFCENAGFTCHDLPSPTTELSPMPRDWIAMQLGRQRQAFAWLQQSSSSRCVLEGLLLMNVERNSQFPFVTYLVCDAARCDPLRLIMQMESHHDAGPEGERLHHTDASRTSPSRSTSNLCSVTHRTSHKRNNTRRIYPFPFTTKWPPSPGLQ
uniref:Uncharacterized protein n=1 Tax=Rhipicephalus zambeziensis TaxID=60191 RepID=A0A224YZ11_9ACAR